VRAAAAVHIATGRFEQALDLLARRPHSSDPDRTGDFLILHALFASAVSGAGPGATPNGRTRFDELATTYVDAAGPHSALVTAWQRALTSRTSQPGAPR
jgi:hypothetical protein